MRVGGTYASIKAVSTSRPRPVLPQSIPRFGFRLRALLGTPSAAQLVATRPRRMGLSLNVFFIAIILPPFLARFNVFAARAKNTFS